MRKLLGYRLKSDKGEVYWNAAKEIVRSPLIGLKGGILFMNDTTSHKLLDEAGVMHWFEEVYEEEKNFTGWAKDDGFKTEKWLGYFDKGVLKYGVDAGGNWFSTASNEIICSTDRPATPKEIQQSLILEAKKRGFKERVNIIREGWIGYTDANKEVSISNQYRFSNEFEYNDLNNALLFKGFAIFKDGKWAEILPTETLNGKTAVIDGVEYELKMKD